jgi:N-glycosylase/DNA lyase
LCGAHARYTPQAKAMKANDSRQMKRMRNILEIFPSDSSIISRPSVKSLFKTHTKLFDSLRQVFFRKRKEKTIDFRVK